MLLAAGGVALFQFEVAQGKPPVAPQQNLPLQSVLELETTARFLAILFVSGRQVINENQPLFDDPDKGDKGFSPEVFERQLIDMFRGRSGIDLQDLSSARIPQQAKELLPVLTEVSKGVVADAQPEINRKGVGFKGFIPAVFGARVAGRFMNMTGVRLKQTAMVPRNQSNVPDLFERAALQEFADPSYPKEKVISEVTAASQSLRLMFPLYATRGCLNCHGEPKGERDKTGYVKEGLRLGQNAGAISVMIPVQR
jgi:general secretion pathway protein A